MGKQKSGKPKRRDTEIEKRKERRAQKLDDSNLHHYNPTSRIPRFLAEEIQPNLPEILAKTGLTEKELIDKVYAVKIVDITVHDAWHELFSNMFAWEATKQITLWSTLDLEAQIVFLHEEQQRAWNKVFGPGCTPRQAIEIIKTDWWPEYPPVDPAHSFHTPSGRGRQ